MIEKEKYIKVLENNIELMKEIELDKQIIEGLSRRNIGLKKENDKLRKLKNLEYFGIGLINNEGKTDEEVLIEAIEDLLSVVTELLEENKDLILQNDMLIEENKTIIKEQLKMIKDAKMRKPYA